VNVARACPRWIERLRPGPYKYGVEAIIDMQIEQWERERRRAADSSLRRAIPEKPLAMMDDHWFENYIDASGQSVGSGLFWSDVLKWSCRWAASELIAECLLLLGADSGFIASILDSIVAENPPVGASDDEMVERILAAAQREPQAAQVVLPQLQALESCAAGTSFEKDPRYRQAGARRPAWVNPAVDQQQLRDAYRFAVRDLDPSWADYALNRLDGRSHSDAYSSALAKVAFSPDPVSACLGLATSLTTDNPEESVRWLRIAAGGSQVNPERAAYATQALAERGLTIDGEAAAEDDDRWDDEDDDGDPDVVDQDDGAGNDDDLDNDGILFPDQKAKLREIVDPRTPLDQVFSATELPMILNIADPEQRALQERQMRHEKQAILRTVLTNLAQAKRSLMAQMAAMSSADNEDNEAANAAGVGDSVQSPPASTNANVQSVGSSTPQPGPPQWAQQPAVARLPGAGWYADPSGAPCWRWWDGRSWTGHTSPRQ
jgi:hypothetical protein